MQRVVSLSERFCLAAIFIQQADRLKNRIFDESRAAAWYYTSTPPLFTT
jgi:hypothetical protein